NLRAREVPMGSLNSLCDVVFGFLHRRFVAVIRLDGSRSRRRGRSVWRNLLRRHSGWWNCVCCRSRWSGSGIILALASRLRDYGKEQNQLANGQKAHVGFGVFHIEFMLLAWRCLNSYIAMPVTEWLAVWPQVFGSRAVQHTGPLLSFPEYRWS